MLYKTLLTVLHVYNFVDNGDSAPKTARISSGFKTVESYFDTRADFIQDEDELLFGSNLKFETQDERDVNQILMNYKLKEFEEGLFQGGKYFGASAHFFHSKPLIEASNVFKIIRAIPKGAALHIHETSAADAYFIAENLTHSDDLYYCAERSVFQFFEQAPSSTAKCGKSKNADYYWQQVNEMRRNSSSIEFFETWLFEKFSLITATPHADYPDITTVWQKFEEKVKSTGGIIKNAEAKEEFLTHALQEFYDDNVMYVEFRSGLTSMYRKNGDKLSVHEAVDHTISIVNKFKKSHPNFWGAKYILTTNRFQTPEELEKPIQKVIELVQAYPDFIVGFDLVGQEDIGNPLKIYVPQLLKASTTGGVKFYFHAGETDWKGSKVDDNLLDAILLNTSRFGHGYSLAGRPQLMDEVRQRQTAVELCPISNQILGLVEDFRNHPASQLLRAGFPVIVSSDDPGVWGASGLSHDWYIAFMAMAGERDDLRFLKQLAINSIQLSAMNEEETAIALEKWQRDWSAAMKQIVGLSKARTGQDFPNVKRI